MTDNRITAVTENTIGYTESEDYRCLEDLQEYRFLERGNGLRLDYCGMERCKPGHSFGPYARQSYVLHIVIEGKGTLRKGDRYYEIRKNQAFLLWPEEESIYEADEENPWIYSWVGFHGHVAEKIVNIMGFVRDQKDVINVEDAVELTGCISSMLEHREITYANYLKREAFLELLMADIIEEADIPEETDRLSEDAYVDMAIEEIMNHYDHPVKVAGIARKIGINRSYLSSIFKKQTGMSPQQFLISHRLEKAAQMLSQTSMAIRTISAAVGYADPLTFSKAFRQKYGMSPSVYRDNPPILKEAAEKGDYSGNYGL